MSLGALCAACGGLVVQPSDESDGGVPGSSTGAPTSPPPRPAEAGSADAAQGVSEDASVPVGSPDSSDSMADADAGPLYPTPEASTWVECDASSCAPVALATAMARPWGIAVDDTGVYAANCGNSHGPGSIVKVPLDGGAVATLAANPYPMDTGQDCYAIATAIDTTNLYWMSYGPGAFVARMPLVGGPVTVLTTEDIENYWFGMAVDATNLYWSTESTVMRLPLDGGAPVTLAPPPAGWQMSGIAVDATSVYWVGPQGIMKTPIDGGPAVALAPATNPNGLAVDGANVYWGESSTGALMSVPIDGGAPAAWAAGLGTPVAIALDATRIYWTTGAGVLELPKGGGQLVRLASSAYAEAIALDTTYVYFSTLVASSLQDGTDAVLRVPK